MFDEKIFKAYDIRGIYPQELDEQIAYLIGGAFVQVTGAKRVAVGRDVRVSGEILQKAFVDGITDAGANVELLGTISTDCLYFAVGKHAFDAGAMITASHNPAAYNGFKLCKQNAVPLSSEDGLPEMKAIVASGTFTKKTKGNISSLEVLDEFVDFALSFIDVAKLKPFSIAVDSGNGVAGLFLPKLFAKLPFGVTELFWQPDGTFPNHLANPIEPENTELLRKTVGDKKLDFGVAFDGDADRMFLVDDTGKLVGGDMTAALVARKMLQRYPQSAIVYNLICSLTVPNTIVRYGGVPIRSRVGHAFIKPLMREHNAIFGGEHSGHFYFRDFWFADSGLIAFLIVSELLSEENSPLSVLIGEMDKYVRSGEINTRVADRDEALAVVEKVLWEEAKLRADKLDGLTYSVSGCSCQGGNCGGWWFNLRPSNTEPLVRLNIEASNAHQLDELKDFVLALLK